ncbi:MAG: hypothetical protein OWQ54_01090 [Sulfolobaceae archaeon]|nr:hypothetical protein [Sulfolobaceae archaeon]
MKLTKEYIEALLISAIPIVGMPAGIYFMSDADIHSYEYLKKLSLLMGISLLSSILFSIELLKEYIVEILTSMLVASVSVIVYKILRSENISLYADEYSIVINMSLNINSVNIADTDINSLISTIIRKALRKVHNPYYREKLSTLNMCSSSPRVTAHEDKLIIRKRCGDTTLEIVITNNTKANIKFEIEY